MLPNQNLTPVRRLINRFEAQTKLLFKPAKAFYEATGINRIRFAQLIKGQKDLDSTEIKTLIKYFNQYFSVKADDLL